LSNEQLHVAWDTFDNASAATAHALTPTCMSAVQRYGIMELNMV